MEKATEEGGRLGGQFCPRGVRAMRQGRRLADSIISLKSGSSRSQVFLARLWVHQPALPLRELSERHPLCLAPNPRSARRKSHALMYPSAKKFLEPQVAAEPKTRIGVVLHNHLENGELS